MKTVGFLLTATLIIILLFLTILCSKDSTTWTNPVDDMKFVRIPAGMFEVTVKNADGNDTLSTVTFQKAFWMSSTEVTVGQFSRFIKETNYVTRAEKDSNRFTWESPGFEQSVNHPVVFVSYEDALAYAKWAKVDVPTEAEWLYACRAGTGTTFYWGDSLDDNYLWHRQNTNGTGTQVVGTLEPNPWGVFNMVGNVREYVHVCDIRYNVRGSSWTRCPSYLTRQGFVADNLIARSVEPRLAECAEPHYPFTRYDDDRGFRCVRRSE